MNAPRCFFLLKYFHFLFLNKHPHCFIVLASTKTSLGPVFSSKVLGFNGQIHVAVNHDIIIIIIID